MAFGDVEKGIFHRLTALRFNLRDDRIKSSIRRLYKNLWFIDYLYSKEVLVLLTEYETKSCIYWGFSLMIIDNKITNTK